MNYFYIFRFATHTLLENLELAGSERVGLSNDGDDIDTRRQTAHKFDINFAKTKTQKWVSRIVPF